MTEAASVRLEAKSPYELRVHLGDSVPEQSVRQAIASGDMGPFQRPGVPPRGPAC